MTRVIFLEKTVCYDSHTKKKLYFLCGKRTEVKR